MRFFKAVIVVTLMLALSVLAYAEPKNKTFTKEEIKKMASQKIKK